MNLTCKLIALLLPSYLGEELGEEISDHIRSHLIGCRHCAWEVESIRETTSALGRSAMATAPSAGFRERLLAQLLADHRAAAARQPYPSRPAQPRRGSRPAFVLELGRKEAENAS